LASRRALLRPAVRSVWARAAFAAPARFLRTARLWRDAGRLLLLVSLLLPLHALAVSNPADMLPDPAMEERARNLGRDIRCMVCQNQSIEDSEVGLARDLRLIVRERIVAGDSDAQVKAFLHARYGDFVLLKPPFSWSTAALWATPAVAVLLGLGLILAMRRRQAHIAGPPPLTEEERRRLAALGVTPGGTGRDGKRA
jgi:cytochrome c-type biogenesis protein CcmH